MSEYLNIVMVGFMGTGKTGAGKLLASELDMTFVDMDDIIVERQARPISAIFEEDGEQYFRSLERDLVKELSARTGLVIATGGGVVLNKDNITDFEVHGLVVCLSATPEVILQRVESDTSRPLLSGDKMKKIRSILDQRQHLYAAITHQVDTSRLTQGEVVKNIVSLYQTTE